MLNFLAPTLVWFHGFKNWQLTCNQAKLGSRMALNKFWSLWLIIAGKSKCLTGDSWEVALGHRVVFNTIYHCSFALLNFSSMIVRNMRVTEWKLEENGSLCKDLFDNFVSVVGLATKNHCYKRWGIHKFYYYVYVLMLVHLPWTWTYICLFFVSPKTIPKLITAFSRFCHQIALIFP